jgi:hypothetical protein
MTYHEPSISSSTPIWGRIAGIAAVYSCVEHLGRVVQAVPSHMAVGCRVQHPGGWKNRQPPLYECPQMGAAFPIRGPGRPARPEATRSGQGPRWRGRGTGHQDCHLSPVRFGFGVYHLVADKAGRASASTRYTCSYQSRDYTPHPCPPRPSLSYGSNLVQKHRSRIRGKKNAIIRIYRHRPRWGQVICFDEMGPLQTIPRGGKAWGKRARLRPDRYKRNGTLQWFCAFSPQTGVAVGKGFPDKSAESCTAFWLEHVLPAWPRGEIHLVMDNLSAHKKALRELPARVRRRIHDYYTPTNSSWLNLIESYFATLQRTALHNTDYKTPGQIEQGLLQGMRYLNENPRVYKWKKL